MENSQALSALHEVSVQRRHGKLSLKINNKTQKSIIDLQKPQAL